MNHESYFGKQVLVGSCFIVLLLLLSNIFKDLRSLKSPEIYREKLSNHETKWGGLMCQKMTSNYIKNHKDWLKNCEKPAEPQIGYVPSTMSSARWRLLPACEEADATHDASEMKILCNSSHLRHPSIGIMYIVFMAINSVIKQYGDGYGIPHETTRASVSACLGHTSNALLVLCEVRCRQYRCRWCRWRFHGLLIATGCAIVGPTSLVQIFNCFL